jgi:hypothetical protein
MTVQERHMINVSYINSTTFILYMTSGEKNIILIFQTICVDDKTKICPIFGSIVCLVQKMVSKSNTL